MTVDSDIDHWAEVGFVRFLHYRVLECPGKNILVRGITLVITWL